MYFFCLTFKFIFTGLDVEDDGISIHQYLSKKSKKFTVGKKASKVLTETTLYKMCYYGWGNIMTDVNQPPGYDRVRKETVDTHINTLKHFEESFTSKHWMVRIFKVKPAPLL